MSYYPDLKKKLMFDLRKYVQAINNDMDGAIKCVACNKNKAAVCPYCFTEYVLNKLKLIGAHKLIIGEFLTFFNFDFDKTGYSREKEEMGLA